MIEITIILRSLTPGKAAAVIHLDGSVEPIALTQAGENFTGTVEAATGRAFTVEEVDAP